MAAAIVLAVLAAYVLEGTTRLGGADFHVFVRDWGGQFLYFAGTALVVARAVRPGPDRVAWTLLATGLVVYSTATLLYVALPGAPTPPTYVHGLWAAFYPLAFVAIVFMLRARVRPLPRSLWVDSLIGALALASLISVWVFPPLFDAYGGDLEQILPLVLYPIGDAMLLTLTLVAISLTAWRPGASWLLLAAGLVMLMLADTVLVVQGATDSVGVGTMLNAPYPIGVLLIGAAALAVPRGAERRPDDRVVRLVYPGACVVLAVGLLVTDQFVALPNDRVVLPLLVIVFAGVRAATTIADLRKLYESRRYERGFEDASIGMALVSPDLRWLHVNAALAEMLHSSPADLVGRAIAEVIHPDDCELTVARRDPAAAGTTPVGREMRLVRADGRTVDVMATWTIVHDEPGVDGYFFSQFQDISSRRRSERQKAAIAALGNFAIEVTDVRPLNQRAVALVAETMGAVQASLVKRVLDGPELRIEARTRGALPQTLAIPDGTRSQAGYTLLEDRPVISYDLASETRFEVPQVGLDAGLRQAASVPVRGRGGSTHVLMVHGGARDRSLGDDDVRFLEAIANVLASALDRTDAEAEVRRRALEDPLTGLANRALLGSQLVHALHAAARHSGRVAVLVLDLDRFKYVNDTLGHSVGDDLLRRVAVRLRTEVRDEDVVARLGGDEFAIVCTDATDAAVAEIAQRIVDVLGEPFAIGESELFVSASVGVAVGGSGATAEGLLSDADAAMYRAKDGGRGRYEIFDAELRARLVHRVTTETALRRALDRDELSVRYQPIVEVATGRVRGYEALLRWHHPERGLVSPAEFIPIAEETDLIVPIGRWVLRTACGQAAEWNALRPGDPLHIAVNLSERQVTPAFVDDVACVLSDTGLPAEHLMLEITESLLLEQASAIAVVSDLRALGVRLALDDFGSGYSSLSYLQSYPLDAVKLDRGFVETLDQSAATGAVVKAAIEMARALGLQVVAEGVERESQLSRLRELGCPFAQGFLFAPALAPELAAELLSSARLATAS